MTNEKPDKGKVEFHEPAVKVVASMKEDENMEEKIREMKANDGYTDYCTDDK